MSIAIATVQITIDSFAPYTGSGGATIAATFALAPGASPGITINSAGNLNISVAAGTPVQLNYALTTPAPTAGGTYTLLGVYFTTAPTTAMGTQQFPLLILSRAESQPISLSGGGQSTTVPPNTMAVIDMNVPQTTEVIPPSNVDDPVATVIYPSALFTYNILVQDVTQPAAIGIIDPDITNNPVEN